jgi:polyisoprenoid-binding protein YceI
MGHDLPNDAVGETQEITGGLTLDNTGALVAGQCRFVVGVTALKSDRDRRDGYVQRRLLETEQYPQVVLVPTALHGVPTGLGVASNAAGPASFELLGDLTVHGVTHPTTWQVVARADGGHVTGTASTQFTFEEFGLTQPRVPIVLSVADTIALEYDFTLARDSSQAP